MSLVIGLTGGFHTGKSTVAFYFKKEGAKVINLDTIAHAALRASSPCFKKIVTVFGKDVAVGNRINRRLLAGKVFGNKKRLAQLNAIVHPFVIKKMKQLIKSLKKKYRLIVVEAPLLFEAHLEKQFDYIVVVDASKNKQITRARKTQMCTRVESIQRIKSQLPLAYKKKKADFIIDNNYSKTKTRAQVRAIIEQLGD